MSFELKILQLISSAGFYGAESVVLQLSLALRRLNCSVVIGAFQNRHNPNTDVAAVAKQYGFEVELFECDGRFDRRTIRAIRECLQRNQIQVLHAHGYKANFYGQLAVRGVSVKQISTAHNWPGTTLPLRFYGFLDRLLLRGADHVCAVSPNVEAQLKKFGTPSRKLSVIENGVDLDQFSNGKPVLRDLPRFQGKVIVGYVGRLVWKKGLRVLLQAAQEITRARPDVVFVFAGKGPDRTELDALVSHLGLQNKVHFLGQRSDLPDVYASFDIFVLPSFDEGMPMAVLEAMAARKPVVATRVGGIPKMVEDQVSGILVEPGNAEQFTEALIQLLEKPRKAAELGRCAFEDVQNRFSSDVMAKSYLNIYRKVLPTKSGNVTKCPGLKRVSS